MGDDFTKFTDEQIEAESRRRLRIKNRVGSISFFKDEDLHESIPAGAAMALAHQEF